MRGVCLWSGLLGAQADFCARTASYTGLSECTTRTGSGSTSSCGACAMRSGSGQLAGMRAEAVRAALCSMRTELVTLFETCRSTGDGQGSALLCSMSTKIETTGGAMTCCDAPGGLSPENEAVRLLP
jgi:hypothetical protein